MEQDVNKLAQVALQQAAAAIQDIARSFSDRRSDNGIRNDLDSARERLKVAMNCLDEALQCTT